MKTYNSEVRVGLVVDEEKGTNREHIEQLCPLNHIIHNGDVRTNIEEKDINLYRKH